MAYRDFAADQETPETSTPPASSIPLIRPASLLDEAPAPAAPQAPVSGAPRWTPIFNYADPGQMDADPDGAYTEEYGRRTGKGYTRKTIAELNLFGSVHSADEILSVKGGDALIGLAQLRRTGTRGFIEALTTGPGTDFVPYVADLASYGLTAADMLHAKKAMEKMRDGGAESLSLQEKVWLKTYQENAIRESQQSWGGLVGSIIRQAPAFAAEMAITGAAAAFTGGTALVPYVGAKLAGKTAKEVAEAGGKRLLKDALKSAFAKGAAGELAGEGQEKLIKRIVRDVAANVTPKTADAGDVMGAIETALLPIARKQADAILNPKRFQGFVDFAVDYTKRGLIDHGADFDMPTGLKARLREAAGNWIVEAPLRGGLYSAFDFFAVNPLAARALGAEEAVTRSELMFASSQDEDIAKNAKWLAFGSSWAEYASEMTGRGFSALGGYIAEKAAAPARRLAGGAMAAVADPFSKAFDEGSFVRRMLSKDSGYDLAKLTVEGGGAAAVRADVKAVKTAAAKAAVEGAVSEPERFKEFAGKSVEAILADSALSEKATKMKLAASSDKAFLGFWLADKMSNLGWGPETAGKYLRRMGYDDLLGEFMEERYNGFVQGLIGVDGQSDKHEGVREFADRLARAAKGFFPAGGWSQASAEIVAFALPMAGRAAINRVYASVGAGKLNSATSLGKIMADRALIPGVHFEGEKDGAREFVRVSEEGTVEEEDLRKRQGQLDAAQAMAPKRDEVSKHAADVAEVYGKALTDQPSMGQRFARGVVNFVSMAITGNPFMMFQNPERAALLESGHVLNAQLGRDLGNIYTALFERERGSRVRAEAGKAASIAEETKRILKDNAGNIPEEAARNLAISRVEAMTSVDSASIDKAIRSRLEEAAWEVVKVHLNSRGAQTVEDADIDGIAADIRKENGGRLPKVFADAAGEFYADGEAGGNAFRKEYKERLKEAARKNLTVSVKNGRAVFSAERPVEAKSAELFGNLDRLFAKYGVNSYSNASKMEVPSAQVQHTAAAKAPLGMLIRVANIRDLKSATPEDHAALAWMRTTMPTNPSYSQTDGVLDVDVEMRDRARTFVAVHKHLMTPLYRKGGLQFRSELDAATGEYTLPGENGLAGTFKTAEELRAAAVGAGFEAVQDPVLYLTPDNRYHFEEAAHAAALFGDYFKGSEHDNNPFRKLFRREGGIETMAQARQAEAEMMKADPAAVQAYREAAEKALSAIGARPAAASPGSRETGWSAVAGAFSDNEGNIFTSLRDVGSVAALIEDPSESRMKASPGVFLSSGGWRTGAAEYVPAAKEFASTLSRLCDIEINRIKAIPEASRTQTDSTLLGQFEQLKDIFNPDKPNIELSKAVAGIVFYHGDSALKGVAMRRSVGTYYTAIGRIAKQARSDRTYAPFLSLVNRAFFMAPLTEKGAASRFGAMLRDLMPRDYLDGTDKATVGGAVNAVEHITQEAVKLDLDIKAAEKYLTTDPGAKAVFDRYSDRDALLNRDRESLVAVQVKIQDQLRSSLKGGDVSPRPVEVADEPGAPAPTPLAGGSVEKDGVAPIVPPPDAPFEGDDPQAFSLMQAMTDESTVVAMTVWMLRARGNPVLTKLYGKVPDVKLANPGDQDGLKKAWEWALTLDPTLADALGFEAYKAAYQKADPKAVVEEEFNEDPETDSDPEAEEKSEGTNYGENSARDALGKSSLARALSSLMQAVLPTTAGSHSAVRSMILSRSTQDGTFAPGSLAELMSRRVSDKLHPAFTRAGFDKWVDGELAKTTLSPVEAVFLTYLKALGFEQSVRLLPMVREVSTVGVVKVKDNKGGKPVKAFLADQKRTAAGDLRPHLIGRANASTRPDREKAQALALKFTVLPALPTTPVERAREIFRRSALLADVADLIFGQDNALSVMFRSERLASHLGTKPVEIVNGRDVLDSWFSFYEHKGATYKGFLFQRLAETAWELLSTGSGEKAIAMQIGRDRVMTFNPGTRGSIEGLSNLYAGVEIPMGKVINDEGDAVSAEAPSMSDTMTAVLDSPEFEEMALSFYGGKRTPQSLKALAIAKETGRWPNGDAVFSNFGGVTKVFDEFGRRLREFDKIEIANPDSEFIARTLAASYADPAERYARFMMDNGDRKSGNALILNLPKRAAASALKVAPGDYGAAHLAASAIAGQGKYGRKRVSIVNNYGRRIPLPAGSVTHTAYVNEADMSAPAREALFGGMFLTTSDAAVDELVHLLAPDGVLKAHYTGEDFESVVKGMTTVLNKESFKNQEFTPALEALVKDFMENAPAGSAPTRLLADFDSQKHSPLLFTVRTEKGDVPLWQFVMEDASVTPETVAGIMKVGETAPTEMKLADAVPGFTIERGAKLSSGATHTRLSFTAKELKARITANLHKKASGKSDKFAKNAVRDDVGGDTQAYFAMQTLLTMAHERAHPKAFKPDYSRYPEVAAAVSQGFPADSELAASAVSASAARNALPDVAHTAATLKAVNLPTGAKATGEFTEDGAALVKAEPYGPGSFLMSGETVLPEDKVTEYGGIRRRPASIQATVGGRPGALFRYALRPDTTHEEFKNLSADGMRAVIEKRVRQLDLLRERNDTTGYIRFMAEVLVPMFTDLDGNKFAPGTVFSFDDLFVGSSRGNRIFDRTAFVTDPEDGSVVLNGGRLPLMHRTPSGRDASYAAPRVYAPVRRNSRDVRAVAYETEPEQGAPEGAFRKWKIGFENVPGAVKAPAEIRDGDEISVLTGHDNDGDTMALHLFAPGPAGFSIHLFDAASLIAAEKAEAGPVTEPRAYLERMVAAVSDPDRKRAESALRKYRTWLSNATLAESMDALLFDAPAGRLEGPAPKEGAENTITGFIPATSAEPFIAELKDELEKLYPPVKSDLPAHLARARADATARDMADARGEAVRTFAALHYLYGMSVATGPAEPIRIGDLTLDFSRPLSKEEWRRLSVRADNWSNKFFDSLKGDDSPERYGMTKALVRLHFLALAAARPTTDEEYRKFFLAWAAWANGPEGKAISAHARASQDPSYTGDGPLGPDYLGLVKASPDRIKSLSKSMKDILAYARLGYADKQNVMAAAAARTLLDDKGAGDAAGKVVGLARAYALLGELEAVKAVMEFDYESPTDALKVLKLADKVALADEVLSGRGALAVNRKASVLDERVAQAREILSSVRKAFAGTYAGSGLPGAVAALLTTENGEPLDPDRAYSQALRMEAAAMRNVYALAALNLMPTDVKRLAFSPKTGFSRGSTAVFMTVVEDLYRKMFAEYARGENRLQGTNPFLDQLMAPGRGAEGASDADKTDRGVDTIQIASRDTADTLAPLLTRGLETLRDEAGQNIGKLVVKTADGTEVRPRDMYWLLWAYTNLAGKPGLKISRSSANFAAAYGVKMMSDLGKAQAALFRSEAWTARAAAVIEHNSRAENFVQKRYGVPAILEALAAVQREAPLPAGELSLLPMYSEADAEAARLEAERREAAVKAADETPAPEAPMIGHEAVRPAETPALIGAAPARPGTRVVPAPAKIPGRADSGPGTPEGTGADQMMRDAVTSAKIKAGVFVASGTTLKRSSRTSALAIAAAASENVRDLGGNTYSVKSLGATFASGERRYAPGEAVAMVAGNSGTRLTEEARTEIRKLHEAGFEFVVGSMRDHTDSDARAFIESLGGAVTVFDWAGRAQAPAAAPQAPAAAPVNVWYGSGENAILSNLAPREFVYDGNKYWSVEHAYQSLKSGRFDRGTWEKYGSRAGVKIVGDKGTKTDGGWNLRLMETLLRESFKQDFEAAAALKATEGRRITHTQDTGIWKTEFPRLLEKIRGEYAMTAFEGAAPQVSQAEIDKAVEENGYVPTAGDPAAAEALNSARRIITAHRTMPSKLLAYADRTSHWTLTPSGAETASRAAALLRNSKALPGVSGTKAEGIIEAGAASVERFGFERTIIDGTYAAAAAALRLAGTEEAKATAEGLVSMVGAASADKARLAQLLGAPAVVFAADKTPEFQVLLFAAAYAGTPAGTKLSTVALNAGAKLFPGKPLITPAAAAKPAPPTKDTTPQDSLAELRQDGTIVINEAAVRADFEAGLPYLRGESPLKGSAQKKEVFSRVDLGKFKSALGTPERYAEFIRLHEEAHKEQRAAGRVYPKDWADPAAILAERQANKYALDTMGISVDSIRKAPSAPAAEPAAATAAHATVARADIPAAIAAGTTREKPMFVYSDGSDIKGTGRVGYGVWAEWNGRQYEISGTDESPEGKALKARFPDAEMSNPTMEMLALAKTLESFAGTPAHLWIRQDYKGAVNYDGLWQRAVANSQRDAKPWKARAAYISYLRDRAVAASEAIEKAGGSVRIEWVRGHQTGGGEIAKGNDAADRAAKSRSVKNDFAPAAPGAEVSASLVQQVAESVNDRQGQLKTLREETIPYHEERLRAADGELFLLDFFRSRGETIEGMSQEDFKLYHDRRKREAAVLKRYVPRLVKSAEALERELSRENVNFEFGRARSPERFKSSRSRSVEAALDAMNWPAALRNAGVVVESLPADGAPLGAQLSVRSHLGKFGVTDYMAINWVLRNQRSLELSEIKSEEVLTQMARKSLSEKQDPSKYQALSDPFKRANFDGWVDALNQYDPFFADVMMSIPIKDLVNTRQTSPAVPPVNKALLRQVRDYAEQHPSNLGLAKSYQKMQAAVAVEAASGHEYSASGKGVWIYIPKTSLRLSPQQYLASVELLRRVSATTWCTHREGAPLSVSSYDNYILVVDGKTVAGLEVIPAADNNGQALLYEATSIANDGVASIEWLDDTLAFLDLHKINYAENSSIPFASWGANAREVLALLGGEADRAQEAYKEGAGMPAGGIAALRADGFIAGVRGSVWYGLSQGDKRALSEIAADQLSLATSDERRGEAMDTARRAPAGGVTIFLANKADAYIRRAAQAASGFEGSPVEFARKYLAPEWYDVAEAKEGSVVLFTDLGVRAFTDLGANEAVFPALDKLGYFRYGSDRQTSFEELLGVGKVPEGPARDRLLESEIHLTPRMKAILGIHDDMSRRYPYMRLQNTESSRRKGDNADSLKGHTGYYIYGYSTERGEDRSFVRPVSDETAELLMANTPAYLPYPITRETLAPLLEESYGYSVYVTGSTLTNTGVEYSATSYTPVNSRGVLGLGNEAPGPEPVPFSKRVTGMIEGYATGEMAVVNAEAVSPKDAPKVFLHEVAHLGMIRLAKDLGGFAELHKLLSSAKEELMKAAPDLLARTGHTSLDGLSLDYGFDLASAEGEAKLLVELAARWAERFAKRPVESWWKRLLLGLRDWFQRFSGVTLTEAEVDDMVSGFVRYGSADYTPKQGAISAEAWGRKTGIAPAPAEGFGYSEDPYLGGGTSMPFDSFSTVDQVDEWARRSPVASANKPLSSLHWYDFEGSDFSREDFMRAVARVNASLPTGVKNHMVETRDRTKGPLLDSYWFHESAAKAVLKKHGISGSVEDFISRSGAETFLGGAEKAAIDELFGYSEDPYLGGDVSASLITEGVTPDGQVTTRFSWHSPLRALPDRVKKQQTLAQQLARIQAPKDEAAAFLKWAEGKTGDGDELLTRYEAEVLSKLEIVNAAGTNRLPDEFRNTDLGFEYRSTVEGWEKRKIDETPVKWRVSSEAEATAAYNARGAVELIPTRTYESLSVNKDHGEYKEYFIRAPFPVPGQHGAFQDPNLVGWFRVREYADGTIEIQEIQSELFQKNKGGFDTLTASGRAKTIQRANPGMTDAEALAEAKSRGGLGDAESAFLNLMLKDQTWVPVFVNAIKQWARNQGFTKVRFPTGETAAKVEGHQALADRLAELQKKREAVSRFANLSYPAYGVKKGSVPYRHEIFADRSEADRRAAELRGETDEHFGRVTVDTIPDEFFAKAWGGGKDALAEVDAEIQQLKAQGIEKLAPIEAFYENRIGKIVERMGAVPVTDANDNSWRELSLNAASAETFSMVDESAEMPPYEGETLGDVEQRAADAEAPELVQKWDTPQSQAEAESMDRDTDSYVRSVLGLPMSTPVQYHGTVYAFREFDPKYRGQHGVNFTSKASMIGAEANGLTDSYSEALDYAFGNRWEDREPTGDERPEQGARVLVVVDGKIRGEIVRGALTDFNAPQQPQGFTKARSPTGETAAKIPVPSDERVNPFGVTPDLGDVTRNRDGSLNKVGLFLEAMKSREARIREYVGKVRYDEPTKAKGRAGALRRVNNDGPALEHLSVLLHEGLGNDPKTAVSAFDIGLKAALEKAAAVPERGPLLAGRLTEALYRDRAGLPAGLQFFGSVEDKPRFGGLMDFLRHFEAGVKGDYDKLAPDLSEDGFMALMDAIILARTWASVANKMSRDGTVGIAAALAEGHPPAETPDGAEAAGVGKAAFETAKAAQVFELDSETGEVDPHNDFHAHFIDYDDFYAAAILPRFRGTDLREILLDKASIAMTANMYRVGNFLTMLLAVGNDKGTILKLAKIKGASFAWDGKGGYENVPEDLRGESRHFERGTAVKDALRDKFTPEEFALAHFVARAASAWLGDGGSKASMPVSGSPSFLDLPADATVEISLAAAVRRMTNPEIGPDGRPARPFAVDKLLTNLKNNLPAALFPHAEAAVKDAYDTYRSSDGDPATKNLMAVRKLEAGGWAYLRTMVENAPDGSGRLAIRSSTFAVPVRVVESEFLKSSAREKLLKNGREAEDLTLEAMAKLADGAFRQTDESVRAQSSWILSDSVRTMHRLNSHVPYFTGSGFHSYLARKSERAPTPAYTERMEERFKSLIETARACFDADGKPLRIAPGSEDRFGRLLKFYSDLFLKEGDPLKNNPSAMLAGLLSPNGPHSLGRDATAWTLAVRIYEESARRIHETAMRDGTLEDLKMGDVTLEEFNTAVEAVSREPHVNELRKGLSWREIYQADGALPRNLGVDEMLTTFAQEAATATRYRTAVNQGLLSADEFGMPLIYAEPGSDSDDTVPERMWKQVALWWSDVHNIAYDNSKSGRQNAREMFAVLAPGRIAESGVAEAEGGTVRFPFKQIEVPPGMTAFGRVVAAANPAWDDTKSSVSALNGGEAAAFMKQIMAIPGYGQPGAAMAFLNRFLSWSKSASVMWSWFFPIATAFESPWAAVGGKQTLLGLTRLGAETARKLGIDEGSPYMADIMRLIGSDDPALNDLKVQALLCGVPLADRSRNMLDHDRQAVAADIKRFSQLAADRMGYKVGRFVKAMLEGAFEQNSEFAFEYIINATKMAVFAQMNNRLRNRAQYLGKWWDPIRSMKEWAPYINAEVGGIDPAMYAMSTPKGQRVMKSLFFSWEWTLGAWSAGGGDVITAKLFGMRASASAESRRFLFGRWLRMFMGIMIGIPAVLQLVSTAFGKASGDDDETKDDEWFNWDNERGHKWKDFDLTPFLRSMGRIPGVASFKRNSPTLGSFIPALSGDEGETDTTRRRRYYAHMGKQGWEVAGWFEDPVKSFLGKMSMPLQRSLEGILGITPSMGWDKDWKDLGFWERWTSLDMEKSALLNMFGAVVPFSAAGMYRAPEAGIINAIMPVGKGMSKTRAEKEMARMFEEWGSAEGYAANWKGRPGAWTDLRAMSLTWLEALRMNGYQPETSLKNALAAARKPLYERVHKALPAFPDGKPDTEELEAAARGLYRLDFVARNLLQSIKSRDKNQNIKRVPELMKIRDEAMRDAFLHPYGKRKTPEQKSDEERGRRSAAKGGDVSSYLSSDKVPADVLGYRILKTEELSAEDLKFFMDNPESPGFFEPGGESGPEARSDMLGGDVASWGRAVDMIPAPAGTPRELTRINGTRKGEGYMGRVPHSAGGYMTEQSIDDGVTLKPLLVPTLTPDEVVGIALGRRVAPETYRKADEFAARRSAEAKPVWAKPGEQRPLHPGLINMLKSTQPKEPK